MAARYDDGPYASGGSGVNGKRAGLLQRAPEHVSPLASWQDLMNHPALQSMTDLWHYCCRRTKLYCAYQLDRVWFQVVMFILTIYALIGDDIRLAGFGQPEDVFFNVITIVALLLFSAELVGSCIAKDDYFLGFFFWLDLIATASLILDITWVYSAFMETDSSVTRAGRMSRMGTRAGRVIRVIRLIRLIRIIKLYKHALDGWQRFKGRHSMKAQSTQRESNRPGEGNEDDETYAESRVGVKLSQMTTQKVILLVLSMLIALPIITVEEFFQDVPTSSQYGADVIYKSWKDCGCTMNVSKRADCPANVSSIACSNFGQQMTMYIGYHHRRFITGCDGWFQQAFSSDCKLDLGWIGFTGRDDYVFEAYKTNVEKHWNALFANSAFTTETFSTELKSNLNYPWTIRNCGENSYTSLLADEDMDCPSSLRHSELNYVEPRLVSLSDEPPHLVFVFDLRPWQLRSAIYNMFQTVFICAMLSVGAMTFSHDANVLVLRPIERMISKVEKIRDNPLYAMKLGDETYREQQEQEREPLMPNQPKNESRGCCKRWSRRREVQTLETKILENAIIKLGKLLALGFGEAGSEIIGKNMDDDSATVNAMIPGNKVEAVFGFCNIRNFTDTTEVLQDKVMVFVNQVAEIVHTIVDTWHGAANRNIGDAFLIIWRMREDFTAEIRAKMAEMSVVSFIQVVAAINKSAVLKDYREHPALLARLPNYRVRMGFGLHYGWAIEGAIGSEFKIDASYLSPHVNMASRLEAATKHYQVLLLMSEPLAQLCRPEMVRHFRTIDHVTLKGGMSAPIRLHTVDINGEVLHTEHVLPKKDVNQFELRMQREKSKEERMQDTFMVHEVFENDPDITHMRKQYPPLFFQLFTKGYLNYEAGEWDVARGVFEQTRHMLGNSDGPSKALLDFMSGFKFDSTRATSKGWPGYRELSEM